MIPFLMIAGGFAMLVFGADRLVNGASALARHFNVPNIVIGLTIVAMGTSSPELVINVIAAAGDDTEIVMGNVMGSNSINVLIILGICALMAPLTVQSNTTWVEIPLSLLAGVVVWIMGSDILLDRASVDMVTRSDGLVLLGFFLIFIGYTWHLMRSEKTDPEPDVKSMALSRAVFWIVVGLALSVAGGRLIVNGATSVARMLGVTERIIALTIVALGTSLPELATSVVAVRKQNVDLAIGNVVGSNIFNIFLVLGLSAVITPIPVPAGGFLDFGINILAGILLFVFVFTGRGRKLEALEGLLFLLLYLGYLFVLLFF